MPSSNNKGGFYTRIYRTCLKNENIMKKYIIILFASLMATSLQAQDTPSAESSIEHASITAWKEREIYQKVYELIKDYAKNAAVSDEEEEFYFRKLFVSENLQVANDLMSLSKKTTLSVDDYIATLKDAKSVKVVIKNLKKIGSITETDDAYTLKVAFEKNISYGKCETYFESEVYFGEPYKLRADISVSKGSGECKISKLAIDPDQYPPLIFPEDFKVLVRTSEDENKRNYMRDNKLTIDGQEVSNMWNRYGQVILHNGQKIKYNNALVEEETIEGAKTCGGHKIRAKYNDQSFRVRANMGYSMSGFNKLDAPKSGLTTKDGETSFGIDVGYILPTNSKFYVGFFAGIGLSMNKLDMTLDKAESMIQNCTEDVDEDTYTRHYSANGINQKFSASELNIPVYADFEYQVIPLLSIYADLGVRMQMTTDKWEAKTDSYKTYGVYKGYGSELKIENYINGFGKYDACSIDVDKDGMTSSMSISVLMGLGLRSNITKNFAIDAGVQYLMGGNSWKKNSDQLFSYTLSGGDKVNLLSQTNGIKRNAFRVTLGLIFKF